MLPRNGLPRIQSKLPVPSNRWPYLSPRFEYITHVTFVSSDTTSRSRRKSRNGCTSWPEPQRSLRTGWRCRISGSTWRPCLSAETSRSSFHRRQNASATSTNRGSKSCRRPTRTHWWCSVVWATTRSHSCSPTVWSSWSCVRSRWRATWSRNDSSSHGSSSCLIPPCLRSLARPVTPTRFRYVAGAIRWINSQHFSIVYYVWKLLHIQSSSDLLVVPRGNFIIRIMASAVEVLALVMPCIDFVHFLIKKHYKNIILKPKMLQNSILQLKNQHCDTC